MTEAPELSIGGGGSVTMMSKRLAAQLQVVAAVGHDDPAVGVSAVGLGIGVVVAEHVEHGRHELDRLGMQPGDERGPVGRAHPERDDQRVLGLGIAP